MVINSLWSCFVTCSLANDMEVPLYLSFVECEELGRALEICGESCTCKLLVCKFSYHCGCFLVLHDYNYTFYVMLLVDL